MPFKTRDTEPQMFRSEKAEKVNAVTLTEEVQLGAAICIGEGCGSGM